MKPHIELKNGICINYKKEKERMKKLFVVLFVLLSCTFAFAEATFDQMQGLIKEKNYAAAVEGLKIIIENHPKSAKAYYAMSQAQAGLGNQVKAKEALDKATGLDPTLKFASSGNVEKLKEAITPQTNKIEAIESHFWRNLMIFLLVAGGGIGVWFYTRKRKEEEELNKRIVHTEYRTIEPIEPAYSIPPPAAKVPLSLERDVTNGYVAGSRSNVNYNSYRPTAPAPQPTHHTTVVNNSSSTDGLVAGMVLGSMMNSNHHDHHERVVEREVVREVEREPEHRSSSWDTPSESKSSSWDDDKPSRSSSWDDEKSSSSSSSSWDSGSSSSSSSSSWGSGSSSSSDSSSSDSSSSWD
jgi:uncharacterized membrane protein YgcG